MSETLESRIRTAIVEVYVELAWRGMNVATAGNVSCRWGDGMLITPTGCTEGDLEPAHIVAAGLDGSSSGKRKPSSEWAMHAEVYRRVPEAGAVVHTHSDPCVALACLRRPIPAFHYMVQGFGGTDVPLVAYHTFGSRELGVAAGEALETRTACLLANHGMLARGKTLRQAFDATVRLDTLARQYLLALSVGEPAILTEEQMAAVRARYKDYAAQPRAKTSTRWLLP